QAGQRQCYLVSIPRRPGQLQNLLVLRTRLLHPSLLEEDVADVVERASKSDREVLLLVDGVGAPVVAQRLLQVARLAQNIPDGCQQVAHMPPGLRARLTFRGTGEDLQGLQVVTQRPFVVRNEVVDIAE
ncbi:hypothetical protein RZS08_47040, partial [Arthrospira platensis SPKY1]|nr:hypothetical protein [Arthrospira platensis SPKY1]